MVTNNNDEFWGIQQIAKVLGCGKVKARALVKTGVLPYRKSGRGIGSLKSAVLSYLKTGKATIAEDKKAETAGVDKEVQKAKDEADIAEAKRRKRLADLDCVSITEFNKLYAEFNLLAEEQAKKQEELATREIAVAGLEEREAAVAGKEGEIGARRLESEELVAKATAEAEAERENANAYATRTRAEADSEKEKYAGADRLLYEDKRLREELAGMVAKAKAEGDCLFHAIDVARQEHAKGYTHGDGVLRQLDAIVRKVNSLFGG